MENSAKIQTFSGIWVDPRYCKDQDIEIIDIAHSLSMMCRYFGHCKEFYSVAQHSVIVSEILENKGCSRKMMLAGLLHDAHEAYLSDMASPIKKLFKEYGPISKHVQDVIDIKYGTYYQDASYHSVIKTADVECFKSEVLCLMPNIDGWEWLINFRCIPFKITPVSPSKAKDMFLSRFFELGGN